MEVREPKSTARQLLESLDVNELQKSKSLKQLNDLLGQSDADLTGLNILRTESESIIDKVVDKFKDIWDLISTGHTAQPAEYKVYRRETPILSTRIPGSVPEWANGAKAAYSLGPYKAIDGRQFWFDFYIYEKLIPLFVAGQSAPVILLPLKLFLFKTSGIDFTVAKGSLWMRANLFTPGLDDTRFVGLNMIKGDILFNKVQHLANNTITINPVDSFELRLTLDNTFNAKGTGPEGLDARLSDVTLPANVHLSFASGKLTLTEADASSWKLYDDEQQFALQHTAAFFNPFLTRLVFPLQSQSTVFKASASKSTLFSISGQTDIISSGWCLNVAVLDTAKPFAVGNNGALAILGKPGLAYHWQGLNGLPGDVKMNMPLVMAEPGKFSVADALALFNLHTEDYQLWAREALAGIRTTVSLAFKKNKPFIYYCDEAGSELVSAWADTDFQIDKPYRADGASVSPKTIDSLYVKYITPGLKGMYVFDLDMVKEMTPDFKHQQKPEVYQFAITNAYMLTTPPASILLTGIYDDKNTITKGNLYITYGLFNLTPTLPHPYTTNLGGDTFIGADRLRQIDDVKQWTPLLINLLMSSCIWDEAAGDDNLVVDFELLTALFNSINNNGNQALPGAGAQDQATTVAPLSFMQQDTPLAESVFLNMQGREGQAVFGSLLSLLDLSTWYDLFGISMLWNGGRYRRTGVAVSGTGISNEVTIEKMNLETPMFLLSAFTLPHIAWEPLNNMSEPDTPVDPVQGVLSYPDNGLPSMFSQLDIKPVAIDPLQHLLRFKSNLGKSGKVKGSSVIFSLPNGKLSLALLSYFDPKYATVKGNLDFIQPAFVSGGKPLKGGLQFRIASSTETGRHKLLGMTSQQRNVIYPNGVQQDISILGESVHEIFQNDFFKNYVTDVPEIKEDGVPITHADFSGYGASMFSDWLNPEAQIAQTSEVRFDVMLGRVSHEVVQVVSIVYPWGIKVVRTITFHRNSNAVIYREDSGWVAQSDGLFDFSFSGDVPGQKDKPFQNPYSFHPGLIGGLYNVHNIKEVDEPEVEIPYTFTAGDYGFDSAQKEIIENPAGSGKATFKAISFDANVKVENLASSNSNGLVTGRHFKGYVQLSPPGVPVPPRVLAELFSRQQNLIGGAADCIMKIGGSEQLHKINRIDASASYQNDNPNDHVFVVAAKGSVQLPAEGSWSVVMVDKKSGEVSPVADKESVPVIRRGERDRDNKPFALLGNDGIVKIAYADSLVNNPGFQNRFAYLQNTGSQKLLLTDPRINELSPAKLLSEAPKLADAFRLLNSKGPFPNLNSALTIENVTEAVTNVISKGLSKTITDFHLPDNLSFDIIGKDKDPLHMYIQYDSEPKGSGKTNSIVNFITDSNITDIGKKFNHELNNLSVVVDMGPFKKLLTITGDIKAGSGIDSNIDSGNAPQLKLCKELQPIYDILEFLANLDPSNPVDAVKKALKVAMSNTADSWEYKFKAEKEIPIVRFPFDAINYNSPTTPLKLDAYFRIGCYYNQPIKIPNAVDQLMPSAGAYLELGADLRVMCFSLAAATVYATGRAQVGLAADIKSGPSLYFKFGFGIELCVGLPVVGSVSVMYLVGVDMKLTTESLTIGAFMYFRGRAEILGGIVTITIQIEASGKIQKQLAGGPCDCLATCTFAIDISIFLVINISFSETWEETRQIA